MFVSLRRLAAEQGTLGESRWPSRPRALASRPCGGPGWGSGSCWASSCSASSARRFRCTPTGCGSRRWASPPSSPRACRSPAGSSSGSPPSSSSSSSSTCRWPPGPPRRTCCGSSRISSGCPDARSWSRSSGGCSCRSSRSSRSSRGPARPARGPPCSSTSTGPRSTRSDPLFGRDLGFYFFVLPFWRILYTWSTALVAGTLVLVAAVYVLQRSLVLTARGPRLAAGARTHLLGLAALLLVLRGVGFWLDRFDLLYAPRGFVFGASYSDVHASLPVLQWLVVLAVLCAAACVFQMFRPGWRFLVAGLVVLVVLWVAGLGIAPALLQSYRVKPNELVYERPYIENNIRMTRQAYALDRVAEKDFAAEDNLTPAALERNNLTIKNIRLWDHRPLLTTYGKLQEIRTYYKFRDVDVGRYTLNGEYRQVTLSARELSYRDLPSRGWINEHLTYTHGYGLVAGPVNRISPEGLPEFFLKDIPPAVTGGMPQDHAARDLLRRDRQRVRVRAHALAGAGLPLGGPERLHALRGTGRHPGQHAGPQGGLRGALRRPQRAAVERPHAREPGDDLPRHRGAGAGGGAVPEVRPRPVPGHRGRRPPRVDGRRLHHQRSLPLRDAGAGLQLHPQLGEGDGGRLPRHRQLLHRRSRGSDHPHLRQGVPGAAQAPRRHAQGPARAHPLPGGSLLGAGADVRDLSHAGSAGLLQQGRPLGHPAAAPGGPGPRDGAVLHDHAAARRAQGGVRAPLGLQPERP